MANVWTSKGATDVEHEVDPISRIEGHLGVKVTVDTGGHITDANAHGNLWRGFENFLLGREVNDAITFVQRICGVCPVPHGLTSTYAVDTVLGYSKGHITFATAVDGVSGKTYGVPKKAVLIRNMVLGAEFLMSSITHFYHLAAPSYIQGPAIPPWTPYFDNNYYAGALLNYASAAVPNLSTPKTWDAVIYSYVKALKIRRMTFEAGALFAGRMPMTSCFIGGGVTNDGTEDLTARITKFSELLTTVANFVVAEYVPIAVVLGALYQGFDSQVGGSGYGAGLGRFLSWGGFPNLDGTLTLPGGVFDTNTAAPAGFPLTGSTTGNEDRTHFRVVNRAEVFSKFIQTGNTPELSVPKNLTEDISNSRYAVSSLDAGAYTSGSAYPGDVARTKPLRSHGYSYIKSPRWNGLACEVGPLARLAVAGLYPVDGRTLASVVPGYAAIYVNAGALDTRVIESTIVAGLSADILVPTVQTWILGLKGGLSTMDRLRARAIESLVLCQSLLGAASKDGSGVVTFDGTGWVSQLQALTGAGAQHDDTSGSTWRAKNPATFSLGTVQGWGGTEAPRGALMHQTTITNGKIVKYQAIVPTTWNGSPKDNGGNRGAIEQAMIGAPFFLQAGTGPVKGGAVFTTQAGGTTTTEGGVEVLRIAQSFDPCIACAIH